MGLFKIFFGKDPEGYEKKGDHCFKAEAYGDAKLEYEAGLNRLEKKDSDNSILKRRLQEKILKSREALALHHKLRGEEIMESEYYEGAEDVFRLALELTENPALKAELQERLQEIRITIHKKKQWIHRIFNLKRPIQRNRMPTFRRTNISRLCADHFLIKNGKWPITATGMRLRRGSWP